MEAAAIEAVGGVGGEGWENGHWFCVILCGKHRTSASAPSADRKTHHAIPSAPTTMDTDMATLPCYSVKIFGIISPPPHRSTTILSHFFNGMFFVVYCT